MTPKWQFRRGPEPARIYQLAVESLTARSGAEDVLEFQTFRNPTTLKELQVISVSPLPPQAYPGESYLERLSSVFNAAHGLAEIVIDFSKSTLDAPDVYRLLAELAASSSSNFCGVSGIKGRLKTQMAIMRVMRDGCLVCAKKEYPWRESPSDFVSERLQPEAGTSAQNLRSDTQVERFLKRLRRVLG